MSEPNDNSNSSRLSPASFLILSAIQMEGGLAVLALLIAWWTDFSLLRLVYWSWTDFLIGIVAVLPPLGLCWWLYQFRFKSVEFIRRFLNKFYHDFVRHCSIFQIFLISMLAGIGEELFFRGLLQAGIADSLINYGLSEWHATTWGVVISMLLFGLIHPISRLYVIVCIIIGGYCSLLFLWTGNLLVPIVLHAFYDFLVLVFWRRIAGSSASKLNG